MPFQVLANHINKARTASQGTTGWHGASDGRRQWQAAGHLAAAGHLQLLDGSMLLPLHQSDKIRCIQPLPLCCKLLMVKWLVVSDLPELVAQVVQGLNLRASMSVGWVPASLLPARHSTAAASNCTHTC